MISLKGMSDYASNGKIILSGPTEKMEDAWHKCLLPENYHVCLEKSNKSLLMMLLILALLV